MENPLVSIIVPCFNQGHYIKETINSIINQTYQNWECIIVNDGSTDNTEEVIKSLILNDDRFKYISIPNSGVCVARNTAVRNSKGDYLYPLDSDNYIHPQCIEKCIQIFINNPNIKLVHTEAELFGDSCGFWNLPSHSYKTILQYNTIDNSSMYLRQDFERVGGYRTNMVNGLEDWDFWIALLEIYSDDQVVKINEPLFYYRTQKNSRGQNVIKIGKFTEMTDTIVYNNYKIYQKYYPDILTRIRKYDYYHVMMNKPLVKLVVTLYNKLHVLINLTKK
jgi:glycosyltransferase involved in cell wall biosynthesis